MLIALLILCVYPSSAQVILIDPGHGGRNCGASFKNTCEKDIVLSIAKKIHNRLRKHHRTYLTRSIDRSVSLKDRAKQAEKMKVDLFISVHANASPHSHSTGFETFYLDNHDNVAVKKLERAENRNSSGKQLMVDKILNDLVIKLTVRRSRKLAEVIHSHIKRKIERPFSIPDRGVRPALFYVLSLSKRPSVLLEVGFLSNPRELKVISSASFQDAYADGVVRGILEYLKNHFKSKKEPLFL
ncbi:MAG: N-acetylmuramoyl-L-alanine amidase [Halobacteriovoraceae bacterium]|nr:N-acetylmuramoyl-L-alanine amidase [Halobacteriovoraceae bacterium]